MWLIINYPAPVTCRGPGYPDGYHSRDKTDGLFAHNVFLLSRRIVMIVFSQKDRSKNYDNGIQIKQMIFYNLVLTQCTGDHICMILIIGPKK